VTLYHALLPLVGSGRAWLAKRILSLSLVGREQAGGRGVPGLVPEEGEDGEQGERALLGTRGLGGRSTTASDPWVVSFTRISS